MMIGRDETRKNPQPSSLDAEVVEAVAKLNSPQLDDFQASTSAPVYRRMTLQIDHAVRQALEMAIGLGAVVVQQEDGAVCTRKVVLEREHLSAVTQRLLGQQPDLRK